MLRAFGITGAALLATMLAAVPAAARAESPQVERARYLFLLHGIPVGVITLELEGSHYRYTSEHLFTRGKQRSSKSRSGSWNVDTLGRDRESGTGTVLESLWLWRRPAKSGCVEAMEELGSRRGLVCVEAGVQGDDSARSDEPGRKRCRTPFEAPFEGACCAKSDEPGDGVDGTLFGETFHAKYEGKRLTELRVSDSQFIRIGEREQVKAPPDLFGAGWPVPGAQGTLAIEGASPTDGGGSALPIHGALPSRRALDDLVAEVHTELEANPDALCTDFVARFVERSLAEGRSVQVVHGVVAEPGSQRAFPHVWIRARVPEGLVEVDPTLLLPVTRATHAPLAVVAPSAQAQAGRAWLDLFSGRAKVIRHR